MKRKQLIWIIFLLLGFGYYTTMSSWELNYIVKIIVAMLPLQAGALIYVTYVNKKAKINTK